MALITVIQLIFLSLAVLQQETTATTDCWAIVANLVSRLPSRSESSCLVRGPTPNRRDDYTYVPGLSGYKLHTRAKVWPEARLICQEEGGYLAIINSVAESLAISHILQESGTINGTEYQTDIGIGFHDLYREGEYVTIHGESLYKAGFTLWNYDQPNNREIQNCGGVNRNGKLNDIWCNRPFGFLCEIAG